MKIYRTTNGIVINHQGDLYKVEDLDWDSLVNRDDLYSFVSRKIAGMATFSASEFLENEWRAPIQHQEILPIMYEENFLLQILLLPPLQGTTFQLIQ